MMSFKHCFSVFSEMNKNRLMKHQGVKHQSNEKNVCCREPELVIPSSEDQDCIPYWKRVPNEFISHRPQC
jgi:hypothetical protein